jgi:hypothetical protein
MARTHGKISTYVNGCRCDECKRAARDTRRRYRHSWRPRNQQSRAEQGWLETEPEYLHAQLRPH